MGDFPQKPKAAAAGFPDSYICLSAPIFGSNSASIRTEQFRDLCLGYHKFHNPRIGNMEVQSYKFVQG